MSGEIVEGKSATKWLNEADITSSTFPYIRVDLGGYSIPYNQIKEAVIEGKTSMSRKGSIKFIDAIGEWPDILMKVGADSNKIANVRKPNIKITFGWSHLRGGYSLMRDLDGMVIRSAIDLADDGSVVITLEYIETVMSITETIRYLDPNDIEIIFKKKEDGLSDKTVGEKLNWLTSWDNNTQVTQTLKKNNIKYDFAPTNDDKDIEFNVGFGDFFVNVINELTSKAKKTAERDVNYSYERGISTVKDGITTIPYIWKAAPDDSNSDPESLFKDMAVGPVLVYKKMSGKGEKQILSFTSDLNSKTSLMMQSQDEISKKLTSFSQDDMDTFNKMIQEKGYDALTEKDSKGFLFFGMSQKEAESRNQIRTDMLEVIKSLTTETSSNQNNQLKAILNNNVFKGNIKIMGDPTFGTDFVPWALKMQTNFSAMGGFGKVFGNRSWALTYVKHTISEGVFESDLEVLAYPPPTISPTDPAEDQKSEQAQMRKLESDTSDKS